MLTYVIPAETYNGLANEDKVFDIGLRNTGRLVKGSKFELAKWGSKKACKIGVISGNDNGNKLGISSEVKIASGKAKRHLDFGAMKGKK